MLLYLPTCHHLCLLYCLKGRKEGGRKKGKLGGCMPGCFVRPTVYHHTTCVLVLLYRAVHYSPCRCWLSCSPDNSVPAITHCYCLPTYRLPCLYLRILIPLPTSAYMDLLPIPPKTKPATVLPCSHYTTTWPLLVWLIRFSDRTVLRSFLLTVMPVLWMEEASMPCNYDVALAALVRFTACHSFCCRMTLVVYSRHHALLRCVRDIITTHPHPVHTYR